MYRLKRKLWGLLLCLVLAGIGVGAEVVNPDTYAWIYNRDLFTLDPANAMEAQELMVHNDIYQRLVQIDRQDPTKIVGDVAKRWDVSADGLTHTFYLREGLTFHDGTPLTAEDVKYSFDRIVLMMGPGGQYVDFAILAGADEYFNSEHTQADADAYLAASAVTVLDDHTVAFGLVEPWGSFESLLTSWGQIVSKDYIEAHGGITLAIENEWMMRHAMGSGPFKFVEWVPGQRIVLERFDGYWRGPAQLKYVIMEVITEPATAFLKLESGEADAIHAIEDAAIIDQLFDLETLESKVEGIDAILADWLSTGAIMLNLEKEPFNDVRFREALNKVFPYELNNEVVDRGITQSLTNGVLPRGMFGHPDYLPLYRQDLDRARELFLEVGWTGTLTVTIRSGREAARTSGLLLKDAIESLNIGIQVDVVEIVTSTWKGMRRNGELEIYFGGWGVQFADPGDMVSAFFKTGDFHPSHTRLSDPILDAMIAVADAESDLVTREQMYNEIVEYSNALYAYIFTGQRNIVAAKRSWVHGWTYVPLRWARESYLLYKEE